jgi:transposase-like protein
MKSQLATERTFGLCEDGCGREVIIDADPKCPTCRRNFVEQTHAARQSSAATRSAKPVVGTYGRHFQEG